MRRIQADGDHDIFFEGLRTLTGISYEAIDRLADNLPIVDPDPKSEEEWVAVAMATNLLIKSTQEALQRPQDLPRFAPKPRETAEIAPRTPKSSPDARAPKSDPKSPLDLPQQSAKIAEINKT